MRITTYHTELDENLHNVLVKESSRNYPVENANNPQIIADMMNALYSLNKQAEEHLYMLALNTRYRILGVFEVSHGTVDASICNPRDVFIKALLCGATGIILVHNHPSGDVTPSKQDHDVFKRVKQAGELIGVKLIDSIILGNGPVYSAACGSVYIAEVANNN